MCRIARELNLSPVRFQSLHTVEAKRYESNTLLELSEADTQLTPVYFAAARSHTEGNFRDSGSDVNPDVTHNLANESLTP